MFHLVSLSLQISLTVCLALALACVCGLCLFVWLGWLLVSFFGDICFQSQAHSSC